MLTPSEALIHLLVYTAISFLVAMAWTPLLAGVLYRYRLGKRIRNTGLTPVYSALHHQKEGTPTMGGVLVWGTTIALIGIVAAISKALPNSWWENWNILSRSQTVLPIGFLVLAGIVGLIDDLMNVWGIGPDNGGLRMRHRIGLYFGIAVLGAVWFYYKLGWSVLYVPFIGWKDLGILLIPYFILVIVATGFSVNETDGLDGLSGGTLLPAFLAMGSIAYLEGKYELAAMIGMICGALLAFLWFNIHPARFFMGDTGAMSLGITLGVVAMLTHTSLLLPIIGFIFVLESLSVLLQIAWRKFFRKKLFASAPIHHHFETKGWGEPKIVMRFWVIAAMTAVVGVSMVLLDPRFPLLTTLE